MSPRIPVRLLILPKFSAGGMTCATPDEACYYHEAYLKGGEAYAVPGCAPDQPLYVRDGAALIVTGMGKVNAAVTLTAVLLDPRFDFSSAYFLSTGCAGGAAGLTVMGDVALLSATADFDLGHHADPREMEDPSRPAWFGDGYSRGFACHLLDPDLTEAAWRLVRGIRPRTTERTRAAMARAFGGAAWAVRDPVVLRGTAVTGDNYWKGRYAHETAAHIAREYGCPDPYAVSEMEDHAIASVLRRMGLLHRLLAIRGVVNMDVFMNGMTPERLWSPETRESIVSEESEEAADIFFPAMRGIFEVGRVLADAALEGRLP